MEDINLYQVALKRMMIMVESRMGVDNGSRREKIDLLVNGGTRGKRCWEGRSYKEKKGSEIRSTSSR